MIVVVIDLKLEHVLINKVIVYENDKTVYVLSSLVIEFENVFIDIEDIINIFKNQ